MSDADNLLPVYHKTENGIPKMQKDNQFCVARFSFRRLAIINVAVSFGSFIFCICWSILFNFEEANATHCSVPNFLPSISAAIGHFYPQIYVWNAAIFFQMFLRFKITCLYYHYHSSIVYEMYSHLYYSIWVLSVLELISLCMLSFITSNTFYTLHATGFVTFLFSSMINMVLTCYLLAYSRKIPPNTLELRTWRWKLKCCSTNVFCFLMAGYFFRRHNTYCEPGIYSLFALFEYLVVASNILFHSTACLDFSDKTLTVTCSPKGFRVDHDPPFKSLQYK